MEKAPVTNTSSISTTHVPADVKAKIGTQQEAFRLFSEDVVKLEAMKGQMTEADYGQAMYQLNRDFVTRSIQLGGTVSKGDLFYVTPKVADAYLAEQKSKFVSAPTPDKALKRIAKS